MAVTDFVETRQARRHALILLLAFNSGAIDAVGLVSLGGVFTSVMTGNMIFFGTSVATGDGAVALRSATAIVLFMVGAFLGARVAGSPKPEDPVWPPAVSRALALELVLVVAFSVIWWTAGSGPGKPLQLTMLGVDAVALGLQSSAIMRFGVSGLSTTYMTGTLATLVASLAHRRPLRHVMPSLRLIVALIIGAGIAAAAAEHLRTVVPALELVPLASTLLLARLVLPAPAEEQSRDPEG